MQDIPQRDYWPTIEWRSVKPSDAGFAGHYLENMQSSIAEQLPGLHSLIIVRHGYIAFEHYYQGYHQKSLHSISSATKSVISLLIGVALKQNLLKDLDQRVFDFFPERAEDEHDPHKQALTLRHMLCLQTGFAREYPHEFWLDPVGSALQRPMVQEPGREFFYDNLSVDILSGILTRITGINAATFAATTVFNTLGIWREETARFAWSGEDNGPHNWHEDGLWDEESGYPWRVNRQGQSTGSFGAHFTAREMAKIGYLYLNGGRWDDTILIDPSYIEASTQAQSEGGPPVHAQYGYLWWIEQHGAYKAYFASGYGGKLIYVVPALDLIVVATVSTEQARTDPGQWLKIKGLVQQYIIPAITKK